MNINVVLKDNPYNYLSNINIELTTTFNQLISKINKLFLIANDLIVDDGERNYGFSGKDEELVVKKLVKISKKRFEMTKGFVFFSKEHLKPIVNSTDDEVVLLPIIYIKRISNEKLENLNEFISLCSDIKKGKKLDKIDEKFKYLRDYLGRTLLHYAAEYSNFCVFKLLLKNDYDLMEEDSNKVTPLRILGKKNDKQIISYICESEYEVNMGKLFNIDSFNDIFVKDYAEITKCFKEEISRIMKSKVSSLETVEFKDICNYNRLLLFVLNMQRRNSLLLKNIVFTNDVLYYDSKDKTIYLNSNKQIYSQMNICEKLLSLSKGLIEVNDIGLLINSSSHCLLSVLNMLERDLSSILLPYLNGYRTVVHFAKELPNSDLLYHIDIADKTIVLNLKIVKSGIIETINAVQRDLVNVHFRDVFVSFILSQFPFKISDDFSNVFDLFKNYKGIMKLESIKSISFQSDKIILNEKCVLANISDLKSYVMEFKDLKFPITKLDKSCNMFGKSVTYKLKRFCKILYDLKVKTYDIELIFDDSQKRRIEINRKLDIKLFNLGNFVKVDDLENQLFEQLLITNEDIVFDTIKCDIREERRELLITIRSHKNVVLSKLDIELYSDNFDQMVYSKANNQYRIVFTKNIQRTIFLLINKKFKKEIFEIKAESIKFVYKKLKDKVEWLQTVKSGLATTTINVDRDKLFLSAFKELSNRLVPNWSRLTVRFNSPNFNSTGIGVSNSFLNLLQKRLFKFRNSDNELLFSVDSKNHFIINPKLKKNEENSLYIKFAGEILAVLLLNQYVSIDETPSFEMLLQILNKKISLCDVEKIDNVLYSNLNYIAKCNEFPELNMNFTIFIDEKEQELVENGKTILLNKENRNVFIEKYVEKKFCQRRYDDYFLKQFLKGFYCIIPHHMINILTNSELFNLLSGKREIKVETLKLYTIFRKSCSVSEEKVLKISEWFWNLLEKNDNSFRQKILRFCTGSEIIPFMGMKKKIVVNIYPYNENKFLPQAHVCSFGIDIINFKSFDEMEKSFLSMIANGGLFGFGFV